MTTVATSRIQRTIAKYRADLLAQEAKAVAILERYYNHTLDNYIKPRLSKLYDEILKKQAEIIANRDPDDTSPPKIPLYWINERIRLEGLQLLISGQIDNFGALALTQTRMLQHTGMQLGLQSGQQQLRDVVPAQVKATFGVPSTKALEGLVGATQAGSPLGELFNGFGAEAADGAIKALVAGVANGDNPRTIAPFVEKALGISRNRALVTARNEVNRCYRSAALETYRANDDVVEGWIWSADLSPRTCAPCIVMNGTKHSLDEEFASHTCCRCAPVPETKSWDDILGPLGIDSSDIPDTRVAIQSGTDWFNEQSEEIKQAILGQAKYAAYNNGDFDLKDIVQHHDDPDWGHSISEKSLKDLVK
jgi:SPP1 gp7 family putative phage head morphogenesis protein